ncbi:MAG TPA: hypothetical protein VGM37_01430 [Armatimonadota bacterium]
MTRNRVKIALAWWALLVACCARSAVQYRPSDLSQDPTWAWVLGGCRLGANGTGSVPGLTTYGITVQSLGKPAPVASIIGTAGSVSYRYQVTSIAGGLETTAATVNVTTAPTALTTSNYVRLSWPVVTGATAYRVYRSAIGGTGDLLGEVAATVYSDKGGVTPVATTHPPAVDQTGAVTAARMTGTSSGPAASLSAIGETIAYDEGGSRWVSSVGINAPGFAGGWFTGSGSSLTGVVHSLSIPGSVIYSVGAETNGTVTLTPQPQAARAMLGNHTAASATPTFAALTAADLPTTGVLPSSLTGTGTVPDAAIPATIPRLASATVFKPASNSTTAFQVQPSGSTTPVFNVDTSHNWVGIGTASPQAVVHAVSPGGVLKTATGVHDGFFASSADASGQLGITLGWAGGSTVSTRVGVVYSGEHGVSWNPTVINPEGGAPVGIGTYTPTYSLHVAPTTTNATGTLFVGDPTSTKVVVKAGSATNNGAARLQEWQDNGGSMVAGMDASGILSLTAMKATAGVAASYVSLGAGTSVQTGTASNVALTVQNTNASPTADLTQWKDPSGTTLSRIGTDGMFSASQPSPTLSAASSITFRRNVSGTSCPTSTNVGKLAFQAYNGSTYPDSAYIQATTSEAQDGTHGGTNLSFAVTAPGSTTPVERLKLSGGTATLSGLLIPDGSDTRDLGALDRRWKTAYLDNVGTAVAAKTASYTIVNETLVTCNAAAGATITLPAANYLGAGNSRHVVIVNTGATGTITVARAGTDTINETGAWGATTRTLTAQGSTITLDSDGVSAWYVTSSK